MAEELRVGRRVAQSAISPVERKIYIARRRDDWEMCMEGNDVVDSSVGDGGIAAQTAAFGLGLV